MVTGARWGKPRRMATSPMSASPRVDRELPVPFVYSLAVSTPDAPHGLTLVEQLRVLGGVGADVNTFAIVREGCRIEVEWSPGSTDSLDLRAPLPAPVAAGAGAYRGGGSARTLVAPRPMAITLREETDKERRHKASGVNREFQTGDAGFDARVYICSASEDEVIGAVLASPDARAAVLDLLGKDCNQISIDCDNSWGLVSIRIIEFAQRAPDQARAERLVQNLARLTLSLPPVRGSGSAPPDPTGCPLAGGCGLSFLGLLATPFIYGQSSPGHCQQSHEDGGTSFYCAGPECCTPGIMGIAAGALVALPLILFLRHVLRGRSDSNITRNLATVVTLALLVELGIIVARFAW
jgi:hypothetical protein